MWRQQKALPELHICEDASIYEVYSIIFSNSSCCWFFFLLACSRFRSLLAFYLIFFDFAMLTETSNTWATSAMASVSQHVCSIRRIRFIIIYPVLSVLHLSQISSSQHYNIHRCAHTYTHPCMLILSLSLPLSVSHSILTIRYFRLFFIAILFDIKMWICAVSFNMWLNVYNGYNVMMRCYISPILNTITLNQSKKFPFIARKWIRSVQTFALQLCAQLKTGCEIEKRSQPKWAQCIGHDGRRIR